MTRRGWFVRSWWTVPGFSRPAKSDDSDVECRTDDLQQRDRNIDDTPRNPGTIHEAAKSRAGRNNSPAQRRTSLQPACSAIPMMGGLGVEASFCRVTVPESRPPPDLSPVGRACPCPNHVGGSAARPCANHGDAPRPAAIPGRGTLNKRSDGILRIMLAVLVWEGFSSPARLCGPVGHRWKKGKHAC